MSSEMPPEGSVHRLILEHLKGTGLPESTVDLIAHNGFLFSERADKAAEAKDDYANLDKDVQIALPSITFKHVFPHVRTGTKSYYDLRNAPNPELKDVDANRAIVSWLKMNDGDWEGHVRTDAFRTAVMTAAMVHPAKTLVVFGCGSGNDLAAAALVRRKMGHRGRVVGVDMAPHAVENASRLIRRLKLSGVEIICSDNLTALNRVDIEDMVGKNINQVGGVLSLWAMSGNADILKSYIVTINALDDADGVLGIVESPGARIADEDWKEFEKRQLVQRGLLHIVEVRKKGAERPLTVAKTMYRDLPEYLTKLKMRPFEAGSGDRKRFDRVVASKNVASPPVLMDENGVKSLLRMVRLNLGLAYSSYSDRVNAILDED